MRSAFQFSLQSLLWCMGGLSLTVAAAGGAFGSTIQVMVFGTAASMLVALLLLGTYLLLLGTYLLLGALGLAPLFLGVWLVSCVRRKASNNTDGGN